MQLAIDIARMFKRTMTAVMIIAIPAISALQLVSDCRVSSDRLTVATMLRVNQ